MANTFVELVDGLGKVAWPALAATVCLYLRQELKTAAQHLNNLLPRIQSGVLGKAEFKLAPPASKANLPKRDDMLASDIISPPEDCPELTQSGRIKIYQENHGLFLAHFITPAEEKGWFDIHVYVLGHEKEGKPSHSLAEIEKAEFYFGPHWEDVFVSRPTGSSQVGPFGVTIQGFGPCLCTCRITLRGGKQIILSRYLDFEMAWLYKQLAGSFSSE